MGYDGQKIAEANRLKAVGGREVGTFWRKNDVVLAVVALVIFFLAIFTLFPIFSPTASLSPEERKEEQAQEDVPRFISPFLNRQPAPHPLPWQKRGSITPIQWPYVDPYYRHRYDLGAYIRMQPWGYGGRRGFGGYSDSYLMVPRERGVDRGLPYFELDEKGLRYGRQPSRPSPLWQ